VGRDAGHLKIIAAALVAIMNNGEEAKERGDRLDSLGSLESSIACSSTALGLAPLGSKQAYLATLTQMPRELGRRGRCASIQTAGGKDLIDPVGRFGGRRLHLADSVLSCPSIGGQKHVQLAPGTAEAANKTLRLRL